MTIGRILAPGRFILFLVLLVAAVPLASARFGWQHGMLAGFDVAAAVFLASLVPLFRDRGAPEMRRRSAANDANRGLLLAITGVVTIAVLAAIALELGDKGAPTPGSVALIVATLALAWGFSNSVYTLHYAHIYYLADAAGGDRGGLAFPDCAEPDYWDFAYFAFTLGMTFQTSDVDIRTAGLRRVALFHSAAAFVFNIGVLAFSINVLGG